MLSLGFLMSVLSCGISQDKTAQQFAQTITEEDLSKHLHIVAADSMEGRYTGSEGQKKAAKYIANHFENIGLLPTSIDENGSKSYFQTFRMVKQKWSDTYIQVAGKKFEFMKDIFAIGYAQKLKQVQKWQTIYYKDEKQALKGRNKNKAVFLKKFGKKQEREEFVKDIKHKGAVAVFFVVNEDEFADEVSYNKYNIKYGAKYLAGEKDQDEILFYVSTKVTDTIFEQNKGSRKKITVGFSVNEEVEFESSNIAGLLEGTDKKDEYVILTAHYDHVGKDRKGNVFNGADDDGSGTVTVLEIAEAFAKASEEGNRPRRSIVFMTVTGEELGLHGSRYYTDVAPIFPLSQTVANLNIDMVGRIGGDYIKKEDPNYVYLIGSDKLSTELHNLSENAQKTYVPDMKLDYKYNDENDPNRFYYRSDHYNFAKNNIPIIFYFNGVHPDYHRTSDTVDKIHFPKMTKIGRLVFHTAWEIANREEKLKVDKK